MTFSFLHAADIHLDSPLRGLVRHGEIANPFVEATRRAFENMISIAIDRNVAFVLISGDLYDGDWRDWASGHFVVRQLARLERAGIPVLLIRGNHDAESVIVKSLPLPKNVIELSVRSVQSVSLEEFGVVVHGRGFAVRHVEENVVRGYPQAVSGAFNIGMLHTSLTGRDGHGVYAPCSIDDLRSLGYQYWALGHVHEREIVCEDPYVVFPGNLQGRHARETGPKGCSIITVMDGKVVDVESVTCDVARFETREIDLAGVSDNAAFVEQINRVAKAAASTAEGRPLALRIVLAGATKLHGRIAAGPEVVREEIQAIAWAISDTLLIEKVRNLTTSVGEGDALRAIPQFDEILDEVVCDPDFLKSLSETMTDLRAKLPPETIALMENGAGSVESHVDDAIAEAMKGIVARLGMDVSA